MIDGYFVDIGQVKTTLFPLILILHGKKYKNFFIITYISCERNSYFKTSSIKTNKNSIILLFKTSQN